MLARRILATVAELEPQGQIVTPFRVEIQKRFTLPDIAACVHDLMTEVLGIKTFASAPSRA